MRPRNHTILDKLERIRYTNRFWLHGGNTYLTNHMLRSQVTAAASRAATNIPMTLTFSVFGWPWPTMMTPPRVVGARLPFGFRTAGMAAGPRKAPRTGFGRPSINGVVVLAR